MLQSIILLVILIFLNATFASAEIAVISMNSAKLRKMTSEGDVRAKSSRILHSSLHVFWRLYRWQ